TGVRVARKTYVVDLAARDLRTTYVAVSDSAMGVVLLLVGAVSSLLAVIGIEGALVFLAGAGFIGVAAGATLPEVSRESRCPSKPARNHAVRSRWRLRGGACTIGRARVEVL